MNKQVVVDYLAGRINDDSGWTGSPEDEEQGREQAEQCVRYLLELAPEGRLVIES